jgi:hypothetical protein
MHGGWLERWCRAPFRVDESGNLVAAAVFALISPGLVMGLVGAAHEIATHRTGFGLFEIVFSAVLFLSSFGIVFGLLLGVPFALAFDRFVAGPRVMFIAGATVSAALVGGLVYGRWWVFAVGAIIQSSVFVALLRIEPPDET